MHRIVILLVIAFAVHLSSCTKKDTPVELPPLGDSEHANIDMGKNYSDQIFFDFETNRIVYTSLWTSWDLAFEASALNNGIHINGAKDILLYNTHETDISKVTTLPNIKPEEWLFDDPDGLLAHTAFKETYDNKGIAKGEVYILQQNTTYTTDTFKKIALVAATSTEYIFRYADLRSNDIKTITIPKNDDYNYSYFSFDNGGTLVDPEPPKDSWDIVFTRYRHVYEDLDNFLYVVTGVLLNPNNTTGLADSTVGYSAVKAEVVLKQQFFPDRDVIGFNWKKYDFTSGKYHVDPEQAFLIKNRNDHYWKLHFLDYYNAAGEKGAPTFEFERIQ